MFNAEKVHEIVLENRKEAIDFLVECIQTPSVTGDELAMSKVITKWIEKIGLETKQYVAQKDRPNILAEWFGSSPGPRFVFNGHMDVFPPVEGKPGLFGPWSGKIKDGYIYGRGSVDMKGGLCATILAVKYLKEMGFDPKGSVLLSCVSDEENGGNYGVKYLLEKGLLNGDYGINAEPSNGLKIQVVGGGTIGAFITYTSKTGHCARPHPSVDGFDALKKSIVAINEFYKLDTRLREEEYKPTYYNPPFKYSSRLSVSSIKAGITTNMYPSKSTFSIDFRVAPDKTFEWAHGEILGILDGLQQKNPEFEYKYEVEREVPIYKIDPNSEMVKITSKAYEDIMGKPAKLYERMAITDTNHIVNSTGMTMVSIGPGNEIDEVSGSSQENERILIDEYLDSIKIYMMTLIRLFS